MRIKHIFSILLLSHASSCFSTDVMQRSEEDSHHRKRQEVPVTVRTALTPLETEAAKRAKLNGVTEKDISEGIETYRKKVKQNSRLSGLSFDVYPGGLISIDNFL